MQSTTQFTNSNGDTTLPVTSPYRLGVHHKDSGIYLSDFPQIGLDYLPLDDGGVALHMVLIKPSGEVADSSKYIAEDATARQDIMNLIETAKTWLIKEIPIDLKQTYKVDYLNKVSDDLSNLYKPNMLEDFDTGY